MTPTPPAISDVLDARRAIRAHLRPTPLYRLTALRERLAGKRIALICSGGNINPEQLAELLVWGRRRLGVATT